MVGVYSTTWQAFADRNPDSSAAQRCDHLARQALDAAKTGFDADCADLPVLTEKPHYMQDKFLNVKRTYHSTSVVGQVHDMVAERLGAAAATEKAPSADPDVCTVVVGGEVVFSVQQEIAYHTQLQAQGSEQTWELWQRWRGLYASYRSGLGSAVGTGAGGQWEKMQVAAVKDRFIAAFDQEAVALRQRDARYAHLSLPAARRALAAVVYYLTYENCACTEGSYRVSFCWEVCGAELHENKRCSVALRSAQHELDLMPAGYLRDMYNINLTFFD
jgi:hypothetical protein